MSRRTVFQARWVLPITAPPIDGGVVVVEGDRIAYVGDLAGAKQANDDGPIVAIDGIIMPGLVNTHSHLELTALRGFLEGLDFRQWLRVLTAVRNEALDDDALRDSARAGIREGLLNGITTFADTAASAAPLAAMRESGVRGVAYLETFGPNPDPGTWSLDALRQRLEHERTHDSALVRAGISPHAPYTVSPPLFEAVADLAVNEALPVAVHIAESVAETEFVQHGAGPFADALRARGIGVAAHGCSPIMLLERAGVLATRPLLIHAIHASDEDLRLVADRGASIAHCPISNLKLGQGIARLDAMTRAGIAVGLGSDSVASNDRMDLLSEARQATLLQSLLQRVPDALSAEAALRLATLGGAEALGLDGEIGSLAVGKRADIIAFPLPHDFRRVVYDPAVALVHALAGDARASLATVNGQVLLEDGVFADGDAGLDARMIALGHRLERWRADSAPRWRMR